MKNWTLENLHVGAYLIPEGFNVYGNPNQSATMLRQVVYLPMGNEFGMLYPMAGQVDVFGTAQSVVDSMNRNDLRKASRDEVRFLLLYAEQEQFAIPPEDEPIDD